MLIGQKYIFFSEVFVSKVFCPFIFIRLFFGGRQGTIELQETFMNYEDKSFVRCMHCEYFLLDCD